MKKITTLLLLFFAIPAFSQIVNTAPYILTVDELKQWTSTGATASTDLIATVNLAQRFINTQTQFNPNLSNDMKIAYLPDGMNNFGNYFGEQSQFNLYNFTHWAYIDKLIWFGGTASQSIQLPSAPWANAAHKNGVKIFGNVFLAPTAFGGATATLTNFLEQDANGSFVAVPKMIEMMQYYNFNGGFINQETATNSATAALMYAFVRDLTAQAEALGKEVMWYDAMILSGSVGWQNRLNTNNSVFVQRDADADLSNGFETRVSSSIFINFFWSGSVLPTVSRTRATAIGRSSFDVFTGVDIWPGRNQGDFQIGGNTFMTSLHENAATPITSLGIFAPNCVFNNAAYTTFNNDPTDYASFYSAENRLFAGDDNNPATVDAVGFKGLSNWIPEASAIATMPFSTDFCTGHGTKKFSMGTQIGSESWHDMNKQALLPTWQWAFSENNLLTANWDFEEAAWNGNSLKITGNLPANQAVDLMLFKTKLSVFPTADTFFTSSIFYKCPAPDTHMQWIVVFADEPNQKYFFPVEGGFGIGNGWLWDENVFDLSFSSREIAMIGLRFESASAIANYSMNIGGMEVGSVTLLGTAQAAAKKNLVTASYPLQNNNTILFTINWPNAQRLYYSVSDMQGKLLMENTIVVDKAMSFPLNTNALTSGTYLVKFYDDNNRSEVVKVVVN